MKKVVICYSGGLDSFAMFELALAKGHDVTCVYFDIGHPYAGKELDAIANVKAPVEVRKIDWFMERFKAEGKSDSSSGNIIIPGRNAVFAQLAASIYQPEEIWMGAMRGEDHDGSTDKNQHFLDLMNAQLGYVHSPFENRPRVRFPFCEFGFGKLDTVRWLLEKIEVPFKEIAQTSSCLEGDNDEKNCGTCVVCARRAGIFRQLGYDEKYEVEPFEHEALFPMYIEMLKGTIDPDYKCHYDQFRRDEIVKSLLSYYSTKYGYGFQSYESLRDYMESVLDDSLKPRKGGPRFHGA